MVKADSHVVREQCNEENPKGPALFALEVTTIDCCPPRDSWRVNTAHVSSFVLISILRGQPRTPPSGDNLGVLDYHLNIHGNYSVCDCAKMYRNLINHFVVLLVLIAVITTNKVVVAVRLFSAAIIMLQTSYIQKRRELYYTAQNKKEQR